MDPTDKYRSIRQILEELKLDKYLQNFEEQAITDDILNEDLIGKQDRIKVAIPVLGHRIWFIKEFETAAKREGLMKQHSIEQPAAAETQPMKTAQLETPNELKSIPRHVFTAIAKKLSYDVASQRSVLRKLQKDAMSRFDDVLEPQFSKQPHLKTEELKTQLTQATETALSFFKSVFEPQQLNLLKPELETLQALTESRKKFYINLHVQKQKEGALQMAAAVQQILAKHFSMTKVIEKFGNGQISTDQLTQAHSVWLKEAQEDFKQSCSQMALYDSSFFSESLQPASAWMRLVDHVMDRNFNIATQIEKTTLKMQEEYAELMEDQVFKIEDFQFAHENVLLSVQDIVEKSDLHVESKQTCLEAFLNGAESLKTSAYRNVTDKIKFREDEVLKTTGHILETHFQAINSVIPISKPVLEANFEACKTAALEALQEKLNILTTTQKKVLGAHFRSFAAQYIENSINRKSEQIEALNKQKWTQLQKTADNVLQNLVLDYTTEMDRITEVSVDKTDFEFAETLLMEHILDEFKTKMDRKSLDPNFVADNEKQLLAKLKNERQGYWQVFLGRLKEDSLHVSAALVEAKKLYDEEMKTKFPEKPWYLPHELEAIHKDLSSRAIQSALRTIKECEDITLSPIQLRKLEDAFKDVSLKYKQRNDMQTPMDEPAIGIDLGTTYSCAAIFQGNKVHIITDFSADQKPTTPSFVAFSDDGNIVVGDVAEKLAHQRPENTVFDAKRLIGRKYADPNVQKSLKNWPFKVVDVKDEPRIQVQGRQYRPEEISSKILAQLKKNAEQFLNRKVITKAVITVPAQFGDAQRKATKDAAEIAGLQATIINEPTAAAICYELEFSGDEERNVLIFDLGGGTFDVVVLTMFRGKREYKVRAIGGDTHLGGRDFDNNMMEALVKRVKDKTGKDLSSGRDSGNHQERMKALSRLRRILSACEEQKRVLSQVANADVMVRDLEGDYNFDEEFGRQEFESINMHLFEKCITIVDQTLQEAKMKKKDINDIVLVGGSTKIPKVQEMVSSFFDGKTLNTRINPDEAVAHGAAFHAALIHGKNQVSKDKEGFMIKDVTPFPLGVAVYPDNDEEGVMGVIIPKNSELPITRTRGGFTTFVDNQVKCDIDIYEGTGHYVKDNALLGQFKLMGIPAAPAGQELIECSMTIDEEGVLKVGAKVVTNGESADLKIEAYNSRMSNREKVDAKKQDPFRWK